METISLKQINIFGYPELYNQMFCYRLYNEEENFIVSFIKKYFNNSKKINILDLAAGTGEIARLIAARNYKVICLDKSFEMCRFATEKYNLKSVQGDLLQFDFKKKFQIILCLFDSITYLQNISDIIEHFKVVKKHLCKNGIYLIEINYPTTLYNPFEHSEWATFDDDFNEYVIKFCRAAPIDFENQTYIEHVTIIDKKNQVEYIIKNKKIFLFPVEFQLIVKIIGGMKVIGFYEQPDINVPLSKSKNPMRYYVVFQKI